MEVDLRPFGSDVRDGDLLVSTVQAAAADIYAERAGGSRLGPAAVLDVVYDPWPTPLAQAAAKSGAVVVSGFDLLLHQAARQVELITGLKPVPLARMRTAKPNSPAASPSRCASALAAPTPSGCDSWCSCTPEGFE